MNTFLRLHGHVISHTHDGVYATRITSTFQLSDGLTVNLPLPFVPINEKGLAVTPAVAPDGDTALRIDLTRWSPAVVSPEVVAGFPVNFGDQSTAVEAAREFDADPSTSWSDPASMRDWLRTRHGIEVPVDDAR